MMVSVYPHYPYFYAAYGVAALLYAGYAISLYRRIRALRRRASPR